MASGQWPGKDVRPACGGSQVVKEPGIVAPTLSVANWRGKPATYGGDIFGVFSASYGETSGFGGLTRKAAEGAAEAIGVHCPTLVPFPSGAPSLPSGIRGPLCASTSASLMAGYGRGTGHRVGESCTAVLNSLWKVLPSRRKRDPVIVSRSMRAVRSHGTAPEVEIRSELRRMGYEFKSNVTTLPGEPDLVFAQKRLAVFVDGDFWHGRQWKLRRFSTLEKQFRSVNNRDYWVNKISSNMRRDRRVRRELRQLVWHVVRVWESDWRQKPARCLTKIQRFLTGGSSL